MSADQQGCDGCRVPEDPARRLALAFTRIGTFGGYIAELKPLKRRPVRISLVSAVQADLLSGDLPLARLAPLEDTPPFTADRENKPPMNSNTIKNRYLAWLRASWRLLRS